MCGLATVRFMRCSVCLLRQHPMLRYHIWHVLEPGTSRQVLCVPQSGPPTCSCPPRLSHHKGLGLQQRHKLVSEYRMLFHCV
jgi:hypothetical protein